MRKTRLITITLLCLLAHLSIGAQQRATALTIEVTSVQGDNLNGQQVTLTQTDYELSYGTLTLDANGQCKVNVYAGNHRLSVKREGFNYAEKTFTVAEGETQMTVSLALTEQLTEPYSLKATPQHDAYTGENSILLSWNTEEPAFFDDFESYDGWAVNFGEWTGIDADREAAAVLLGSYPNRGVLQYAQIINPLTVEPTWWYDYPILRPYEGSQYVGFTRTNSGNANDDWLISPAIEVGNSNVLSFMAKAADQWAERFQVYVTTKLDSPTQNDFTRLDKGNYETADYTGWKNCTYDLADYAGKTIKFAIRYISHYNYYGSFMLMVDNVFVGQQRLLSQQQSPRRMARRSPDNPNETFAITLDGTQVGVTDSYSFLISNIAAGSHTIGVQAVYKVGKSSIVTTNVSIPSEDNFAKLTFNIKADSKLSPDGQVITLVSNADTQTYRLTIDNATATITSLPKGSYLASIDEGAFETYRQTIDLKGDLTVSVELSDNVVKPFNLNAFTNTDGSIALTWNRENFFTDSFEDYDDFATGSFGEWLSIDRDQQPVYPIALGAQSNIVTFPGSGTAYNPTAIAPMVFNPWKTTPAMLPTDNAIQAPTGDKTMIFFSAQRAKNDKWLISPEMTIGNDYVLSVKAKAYEPMYPESMEFCVSEGSTAPADFKVLSEVSPISGGQWTLYQTSLKDYADKKVRLAVHYTSYDAFLTQIDDFTVGTEDGEGEVVAYGNIVCFEVYVDGTKIGETQEPTFLVTGLSSGQHTLGVKAIYQNAASEMAELTLNVTTDMASVKLGTADQTSIYNMAGQRVSHPGKAKKHGVYIERSSQTTRKRIY